MPNIKITNRYLFLSITYLFSVFGLLFSSCQRNTNSVSIDDLKCEHLSNPLGIDCENPRFTWQLNSEEQVVNQTAYQLFVGTDSLEVSKGVGNQWESGTVQSGTIPVLYDGPAFKAFTRYYWGLKIKDTDGNWSPLSKVSWFETGMLDQKNWEGNWISDSYDYFIKPSALFRKSIPIEKAIQSAKVYIAVGGLYELSLNGEKVGDHILDPMFTRYDRRNLYVSYDVTNKIIKGENVLGVHLGNGWYNHQPNTVWYFNRAPWRARSKFCLDFRIKYVDGTEDVVSTDTSWKTAFSPVTYNNIYIGEHYDARQAATDWDKPGFDDSGWKKVLATGAPSTKIVAQTLHPIRDVEVIPAKEMTKLDEKTYVFNFGKNISGTGRLSISGEKGTVVKLTHAERLDENGHADISKIFQHYTPEDDSAPMQTDVVILSGKEDHFRSVFTYKGFQYVEASANKPINLTPKSLEAIFIHSDLPQVGSINSSNELINKIWKAGNTSYLSNMLGYPTDCPTREKNGWTGDAHIAIETGLYNYDGITLYEKWLADHQDEQQPNGVLPAIIPSSGWGYHWANGVDWTSTIAIIPWNVYLFYGDSRLLENCYENIKRYVHHLEGMAPNGLIDWGLGDWIPVESKADIEFTTSIYYFVDVTILAKAAQLFNKEADAKKYQTLAHRIKDAINEKYLDTAKGIYANGFQTELSMALYWGIVPEKLKSKIASQLAKKVQSNNNHLDVGLLGSKALLNALTDNGYADLAYEVATQKTYPAWGYWINNGATTLYEDWKLDESSLNHIMFGEVSAWFYKGLGGIYPDEASPGFKNIILKPNFVKGLNQFEAKHESPYGEIISSWKREDEMIKYDITIPHNSHGVLYLDSEKFELQNKDQHQKVKVRKGEKDKPILIELESGNYRFCITY